MKMLISYFVLLILTFSCADNVLTDMPVSAQEKADLVFLREEEKLAHDVYVFSAQKYGQGVFSNISESEQRHMESVLGLLNRNGIEDPVKGKAEGVFENAELQKLYDELTQKSGESQIEALKVGATIEDLDIFDIKRFYQHTSNPELIAVYDRLTCGSRNHMRAFVGQLQANQVIYTPQYLTVSEFNDIVNSAHERCGKQFQN